MFTSVKQVGRHHTP